MVCSSGGITANPNFLFHPCRAVNVGAGEQDVAADAINLVAASSRFGLVFVGSAKGVKIYSLEAIQDCGTEDGGHAPVENCPSQLVPILGATVLVSLSADDLTLAVGIVRDSVPVVDMYDVRGFGQQPIETRPFFSVRLSSQPSVGIQDFSWNPVVCDMFTACLTDGSVTNYELSGDTLKILGSIPSGGRALAWSPKGKQVVVGKQDGSLVQYKPTMQEAKVLPPPTLFENPVQVTSVCWIAPTVFAAVYQPLGSVDMQATLVVTAFSKTTPTTYTAFEEPCMKTGEHPKDRFWLFHQPEWGILVYASRNSIETAVFGCTSADKMKWEQWELDSHGRAEMPLNKGDETFPLGMAVIYSAQRRIMGKLESWPPMPVLLLVTTCNVLTSFHMKNLAPGVPSLVRPPEPLRTEGQRKPMANAPRIEVASSPALPNQSLSAASAVAAASTSSVPQRTPQASVFSAPQFSFGNQTPSTFTFPSVATSSTLPFSLPKPAPVTTMQLSVLSTALGTTGSTSAFAFGSSSGSSFAFGSTGGTMPTGSSVPAPTLLPQHAATSTATSFSFNAGTTAVTPSAFSFSKPAVTTVSSGFSFGSQTSSTSSAFTFVPAQKTGLSGSATAQAGPLSGASLTTTTSVAGSTVSAPHARTLPKSEVPASKETPPTSGRTALSDGALLSTMVEEVSEFTKELESFKERASKILETSDTQEQMNRLRENGFSIEQTCKSVKKELDVLNDDVHALNSLVLETFAAVEEGRTQELRNRDPRFVGLLRDRGLDPVTAQQLSEVRRLHQYLEAQLREVHAKLDLDWQEHLSRQKEKRHTMLPSTEAIYRAIVNCRNTSQSLTYQVDALCRKVKELKLQGKLSKCSAHWSETLESSASKTDELSALADSLLRTSLLTTSKADDFAKSNISSSKKLTLSPQKQAALAEYFGQRSAIPVRARVVEKPSESRLLSRLAVLMNESSVAAEVPEYDPQKERASEPAAVVATTAAAPIPSEQRPTRPVVVPVSAAFSMPALPVCSTPIKGSAPTVSPLLGTSAVATVPIQVPLTKVIEVSIHPKDSGALPILPAGLSITAVGAAPPEISAAAVKDIAKPLPTRTEATASTKAGFPQFAVRTDAKPKLVAASPAPSISAAPSSFAFGATVVSSSAVSVPTTPVFSFGKSGGPAPITFNFGTAPPTKPGFVAVKPSLSLASATALADKKVDEQQRKTGEALKYEDVTPPGSPRGTVPPKAGAGDTAAMESQRKGLPGAAHSSAIPTAPVFLLDTSGTGTTKVATTAAGTTASTPPFSFPTTQSPTASGFKLNLSQPTSNKSIFGNSTSNATSAAAFSFTAALAACRNSAVPSTNVETASSSTAQVLGAFTFKPSVTSPASPHGAAVVTVAATSAPSQPVSMLGSQGPVSSTATSIAQVAVADAEHVLSKPTADKKPIVSTASAAVASPTSETITLAADVTSSQCTPSPEAETTDTSAAILAQAATTSTTTVTSQPSSSAPCSQADGTMFASPFWKPSVTLPVFGQSTTTSSVSTKPVTSTTPSVLAQPTATSTSSVFKLPTTTATVSLFGQPVTTSAAVGQPAMTSTTSAFGQPVTTSTPLVFGQLATTSIPLASGRLTTTTTPSSFGQLTTTSATSVFGQSVTPSATPVFGQPATTSTTSVFGQPATTSTASVFGQAATTSTTSVFGQPAMTSTTSVFGQPATTSTTSVFGQPATTLTTSVFGQPATTATPSSFGQSATTSMPSAFGQQPAASATSAFGQSSTTSTTSVFGQPAAATASTAPIFGRTDVASGSSMFGVPATTSTTSAFGVATSNQSVFGQTSGSSAFGQPQSSAPSVFGQSSVFSFGQQSMTTSPFGQMATTSAGTSGSLFGQKTGFGFSCSQASTPFGQTESLFGQKSSFGQPATATFGQPQGTHPFGQQPADQPGQQTGGSSLFGGGGGFLSGLGGKPSAEGPPKNIFGGSSGFGSGAQTSGLFGSQGASAFGTSFGGSSFSGGSFSAGGGSVAQSGFGAFQQQTPTKPAAFGGPPTFGGSPSFGGPPQFGGSPTFGSSPTFSSPFGTSQSAPQSPQQQGPSAFSAFGSTEAPTFGSLAAQTSPGQQQQEPLRFGSPNAFGSGPSFGSPGFGDQSGTPRPSSAFSQWRQ